MNRLVAFLFFAASPAFARDLLLIQPIDCTLGETCFIQQYVDADPGPGAADFTCGPLSYDGHDGTDFALPSLAAMEAGVKVRAAAPGVVRALRDGMPDLGLAATPPEALEGKGCGNGVVLDHGGGWTSQYCHMKQGSIAVAEGQRVAMGTPLGLVGFSGNTEFPHLELVVRRDGEVVDPFNTDGIAACEGGDDASDDLWADPLPYAPGGLITVGADRAVPDYDSVKSGAAAHATLPADSPALVGWAYLFGGRVGDVVEITLMDPDGQVLLRHEETLEKTQAQLFRAAGKTAPEGGWAPGDWIVEARLIRAGAVIDQLRVTIRVGA